jgi:hypothetical protein
MNVVACIVTGNSSWQVRRDTRVVAWRDFVVPEDIYEPFATSENGAKALPSRESVEFDFD